MTKNHYILAATNKDGRTVFIDDVPNGKDCGCVCKECGGTLIAKNNGEQKAHHFAHRSTAECAHGYQSALHYMAKDVFREMKEFTFIKNGASVKYRIDGVVLEKPLIPSFLIFL